MLQLGEEAENRLSTEKHKVLRLLGIRLRPALPSLPPPTPPPHKDIIGKGTLASVLLTKRLVLCSGEKRWKETTHSTQATQFFWAQIPQTSDLNFLEIQIVHFQLRWL